MAQETSRLEDSREVRSDGEDNENRSDDTERIQAEIVETRADMGETIDAIQDRLSYSNIAEKVSEKVGDAVEVAKDTAYDATVGKAVNFMKQAGNGVMETSAARTVKENPLPIALIGIGSALLIYNSYTRSSSRGRYSRYSKYGTRESFTPQDRQYEEESTGLIAGAKEKLSDKADGAYEKVSNVASSTLTRTSEMANKAYERAGELGTSAQETYDRYIEERPLAVVAAAAAVGAAIGFAIPSTTYEGELMGDARQNVLDKAQETATDLVDKAKEVVGEVTEKGMDASGKTDQPRQNI